MTGVVPRLTLRGVDSDAVLVPMRHALGTSAAIVRQAPLLLVTLHTDQGVTGRSYLFCYRPAAAAAIARMLEDVVNEARGEPVAPLDLWPRLARRYALIGVQGIVRMALSALDIACWDALAVAAGLPLAEYLGGTRRAVPAYNSCGLGLGAPAAVADEAEELAAGGFKAVKLRLGHPDSADDLAAVRAVRKRLGDGVAIPVDYNQALDPVEALARCRMLDAEDVLWIEEPIRHDAYAAYARLARETATPIQLGENFGLPHAMRDALDASACDLVMPDVERIGGVTGWLQAAGLAAAHDLPMSTHLFPEIGVHLLPVTPTRHWLEYVDWLDAVVEEPLAVTDGLACAPDRPGLGLSWDRQAVRRHALA